MEDSIERGREFLKDTIRMRIDFTKSDQNKGIAPLLLSLYGLQFHTGRSGDTWKPPIK